MRLPLTCAYLAALTAALVGCGVPGVNGHGPDPNNPTAVALVFVDVSRSTYGPNGSTRKRYIEEFGQIVRSLPGGTLLKGDILDINPLRDTTLPISAYFEKYGGITANKNEFQVKQDNKAAAEKASRTFSRIVRQRPFGDSILDSLDIAQNVFASFPSATQKYLILFSDMIETSRRYRFTRTNLTPRRIHVFIARDRRAGRLPDLRGIRVYVVGAGVTRGSDAKAQHTRDVEAFWLAYFRATAARLDRVHYGPTLIRFP